VINVINRVADALGFPQLAPEQLRRGARMLLQRGYQV